MPWLFAYISFPIRFPKEPAQRIDWGGSAKGRNLIPPHITGTSVCQWNVSWISVQFYTGCSKQLRLLNLVVIKYEFDSHRPLAVANAPAWIIMHPLKQKLEVYKMCPFHHSTEAPIFCLESVIWIVWLIGHSVPSLHCRTRCAKTIPSSINR
jgi:hypothetical protein